uniref:P2Y purinoceptor 1 n=1 Tax=Doryrhamphus excisus TaxID=161450 RepID=UPI0025ADCBDE|nr:P2Y purinoceptor 1 [Doryrhamphus excisus]
MFGNITQGNNNSMCGINIHFTHAFLPPVYIAIFVVGTLSNMWGLRSVCLAWNKIGSINIFMLNLGLADLQYLFTLPFLVAYYARNSNWTFGQPFCKVTRFCFNLNLYGSIGFLTCISIYRYLGVVHPMKVMGKISSRHSLLISAVVWLMVVVQILPDMFFDKNDTDHQNACFDTTSNERIREYLPYSFGWTLTGFAVPLLIIVLCYGHVVWILSKKSNINPLLKQRSLKLVLVLLLLFSVCFVPYHIFRNLNLQTRILKQDGVCLPGYRHVYIAHQVGRCLACMNSAINPLIYIVGNDQFFIRLHRLRDRTRESLSNITQVVFNRNTSPSL